MCQQLFYGGYPADTPEHYPPEYPQKDSVHIKTERCGIGAHEQLCNFYHTTAHYSKPDGGTRPTPAG